MAQYTITATSAMLNNAVETNTAKPVLVNPAEEGMIKSVAPVIPFPSPAEFADQAIADANAQAYAKWLRLEGINFGSDWIGQATAV